MLTIGGLLVIVKANRKVDIDWDVSAPSIGSPLLVTGCLAPPLPDVLIVIEVTDPRGKTHLLHTRKDSQGSFRTSLSLGRARYIPRLDGNYTVQVFVAAGGDAAETQSGAKCFSLGG